MNLDQYSDSIREICRRFSVKRLDAFGSAVRDDFREDASDIDLFYEFDGADNLFARFMGLKRELERLFGRNVDLVKEDLIENPFLKKRIDQSPRKRIYGS